MPVNFQSMSCVLQILSVFYELFGLIQAGTSQDIEMTENCLQVNDTCSICNFGSVEKLSAHTIPDNYSMLKIEHTIYPLEDNRGEVSMFPYVKRIGDIPLKHMKCSIMSIRLAMMQGMYNMGNVAAAQYFGQRNAGQVIDDEFRWIAKVLLTLRFEQTTNNKQEKGNLNCVLKYLAITLPDIFSSITLHLEAVITDLNMNIHEESIRNLFDKLSAAEQRTYKYQLNKTNQMELKELFSMTDGYFLYLISEEKKFREIYCLPSIMQYLITDDFSRNNAFLEPFDVCKTVFICFIVSLIKRKQEQKIDLKKFLRIGNDIKAAFLCQKIPRVCITEILKRLEEFDTKLDQTTENNNLLPLTIKLDFLKKIIVKIVKILNQALIQILPEDKSWILKQEFFRSHFLQAFNHKRNFNYILNKRVPSRNYKNILKYLVNFGMNSLNTKDGVSKIFDAYREQEQENHMSQCTTNTTYCHECRFLSTTICYTLNFVMHRKQNSAIKNYRDLINHELSQDFRVKMALDTAFFAYHIWHQNQK